MRKIDLMKKCGWFLGCFLAVTSMTACTDDENKVEDLIPGNGFSETITVLPSKGSQVLNFTANSNWTAKSSETWLKLDGQTQTSGKAGAAEMYVSFDTNELVTDRTADITLSVSSTIKTIKVTQKAAGRVIAFDGVAGDTLKMAKDQKEYEATMLANVTWEFVADSLSVADKAWVEVTPKDGKVAINILNQDGLARTARLVFRDKNFSSFTKALFVAVEGWGEDYVTWTLDTTSFTKDGGLGTITVSNVPEVAPRAFKINDNGFAVNEKITDWIEFKVKPATKTAVQTAKWEMTVDTNKALRARSAAIFVVPTSMSDAEVITSQNILTKVTVVQQAVAPNLQYSLYHFVNGAWTGEGVLNEFLFKSGVEAITLTVTNPNCTYTNLRVVILDAQGNESKPVLGGANPTQIVATCNFRPDNVNIDATITPLGGMAAMNCATNWIALDMMDGNTKLGTSYFKVMMKGVTEE